MTTTLCGASWYNQKYYLNPAFDKLPESVRDELQIMAVEFTEDVGGVFTIEFGEDRLPRFSVRSAEGDPRFDEIGAELKIRKLQREKEKLLIRLALFYRIFVLGEPLEKAGEGLDLSEVLEQLREEPALKKENEERKEVSYKEESSLQTEEEKSEQDPSEAERRKNLKLLESMFGEDCEDALEEPSALKTSPDEGEPYRSPFERLAAADVSFVPLWPDDLEDEE